MFIKELFGRRPVVSFEIFPPRREVPLEEVYRTLGAIRDLGPDFVSVTYGAGGSTRDSTLEIASTVKNRFGLEVMAHCTGLCHGPVEVDEMVEDLMYEGVYNLLAMRGDPPRDGSVPSEPAFLHAVDLIRHLRLAFGDEVCIAAAAYPEGHVEAEDLESDLRRLKEKVDAGVDFLVTQLFFDNELFYRFLEKARGIGIDVPVLAGVFPVLNGKQVERIVSLCGVSFPPKFTRMVARYADDPAALAEAGVAYATEQIVDLLAFGVDGVHIYTMNRPETTRRIMNNIGLVSGRGGGS
ncbi:MAG: methylenetetrahydrofolate reductase [Thermanaerothrix sp.]|nr:methylenetetrahydrofolate reductase [Thermanaerothrix sp.]